MATMSQEHVLRIQQGQELQFHVSRDICCEYSLLNPAYRQAQRALIEILNHTRAFHARTQNVSNDEHELFEYGGNIILFAAPRGGGKTRMMLSFSHVLETPQPKDKNIRCLGEALENKPICNGCKNRFYYASKDEQCWLEDSSFLVTEPIASAVLEKEQSILYVVLSRLYRYTEKLLKPSYNNTNISESQKNSLRKAFHYCLSGINGIKKPADSVPEDFSVLQDISDGLSLRYHFYRLITTILEITAPNHKKEHRYLILQIDDADSKTDGVYEVFEDIRKYLLIPNLVILMSADVDFLHRTITEEHLKRFATLQRFDSDYARNYSGELSRIARKYIDKLVPPSHQIILPEIGRMSAPEVKALKLSYITHNGDDMLSTTKGEVDADPWNLENSILMLLYQKTGVLFACPSAYLHNIIPRTQRGLNQLLFILSEMEDIPREVRFETKCQYLEDVLRQVEVEERNLARFTEYFIYDWINVKIKDFRDRDFLNSFSNTVNSNFLLQALQHISKKYSDVKVPDYTHAKPNRYTLEWVLGQAQNLHRKQEDYLFFFAIRTLLSLNCHQFILWEKKQQALKAKKEENSSTQAIVWLFNPENTYLPHGIMLRDENKPNTLLNLCQSQLRFGVSDLGGYASVLVMSTDTSDTKYLSFMNIYLLLLNFISLTKVNVSFKTKQKKIHALQEYALLIAANGDIYEKLCRMTEQLSSSFIKGYSKENNMRISNATTEQCIKYFTSAVDEILRTLNNGTTERIIPDINVYDTLKDIKTSTNTLLGEIVDSINGVRKLIKEHEGKVRKEKVTSSTDVSPEGVEAEQDDFSLRKERQYAYKANIDWNSYFSNEILKRIIRDHILKQEKEDQSGSSKEELSRVIEVDDDDKK